MLKRDISQLTEIKKGQTGTGILIENDGHILAEKDTLNQIKEDMRSGHEFVCPDHFVVSAVFQKYGIPNANNRIYPESILRREVDKYIRERVNMHCAIGALDHPSCQLADTKLLTEDGWKPIKDVSVGENILTVNENRQIEVFPVVRKIEENYKGKMYRFKSRFIDITVTPNHKFPLLDKYGRWKGFYTAEDIFLGEVPDLSNSYFFKTGEWHNHSDNEFVINGLPEEELQGMKTILRKKYSEDIHIPSEVWMKFMGIYLSDGDAIYIRPNGKKCGKVNLYQEKESISNEIEEMLQEFPLEFVKYHHKNGRNTFTINDLRLSKYLSQLGKDYAKYVPCNIKRQGRDMLKMFYDWFVMGEGMKKKKMGNYYTYEVFSTSKRLVMDLNEIQLKIGYCGSYHEGHLSKTKDTCNVYFTMRHHGDKISLNPKNITITEEEYDGKVYCVEVENHTFYTMCNNGMCLWSGNSSSLSGHDVSHNILELHWENQTLVGKMELHLSPGYRKYGICSTSGDLVANMLLSGYLIGVSSRGVGSVKQIPGGKVVVDDDFELICWDVVLEPSTPNAWIKQNPEELQPFIENDVSKTNSPLINEKIIKINKILGI